MDLGNKINLEISLNKLFFLNIKYIMDQYATRIEDLQDADVNNMFEQENDAKHMQIQNDDNISLQIKKEKKGFFSSFLGTYFNEEVLLLILFFIVRTFPINKLVGYIPVVNSLIPDTGLFTTIVTSILLAVLYVTILQFK